ncbi:hypothetical protein [Actinoplanes sp. N902-109]|uniref:hypothetical protein n=1 Tax=Actinoplanes sp. (strain N902-109) TaxID=649831 RepID=UPI0003A2BE21|nr:hypothetical protein [Actinoplanes sp. N902-109]
MPDVNHPDAFGPASDGERTLWRGRCAVAEYAFDQAASLPRWTLPETTEVLVTNHRIRYAHAADGQVTAGELPWLHPEHIRIQPGQVVDGRPVSATQLQLVCPGADHTYPALVFAGGELAEVSDADKLANVIRHAIARFRVDNASKLGLVVEQARELAKMLVGPEFSNREGGEGQTVSMIGAIEVPRRTAARDDHDTSFRAPGHRPGRAADESRAQQAAAAEQASHVSHPDLATRAANVAARIAELVAGRPDPVEVSVNDQLALPSGAASRPILDGTIVTSTATPAHPTSGPPATPPGSTPPGPTSSAPLSSGSLPSVGGPEDGLGLSPQTDQWQTGISPDPMTRSGQYGTNSGSAARPSSGQYGTNSNPAAHPAPGRPATGSNPAASPTSGQPGDGPEQAARSESRQFGEGSGLTARAERLRRATARFSGNSARGKATVRRPDHDADPSNR